MKHEYEYKLVGGHIIVKDGSRELLIDTGAPSSVGDFSPNLKNNFQKRIAFPKLPCQNEASNSLFTIEDE